jgi:hypothetical protein
MSGVDVKVEDYKPECIGFVPVMIIKIRRDDGEPKTFEFQCDEDSLKSMINTLQSAIKDLEAAKLSGPQQIFSIDTTSDTTS